MFAAMCKSTLVQTNIFAQILPLDAIINSLTFHVVLGIQGFYVRAISLKFVVFVCSSMFVPITVFIMCFYPTVSVTSSALGFFICFYHFCYSFHNHINQ